jgi:maleate cis-trans isomerase
MAFDSWRGVVGDIKPTMRPGALEELIRMLPDGIGVIPLFLDIRDGKIDTFKQAVTEYEPLVARLAEAGVDLIHPEGAPPFMVLGHKGESQLLERWEREYKVPVFTSGTNHVRAFQALKVKRFVGVTYFSGEINNHFARYFKETGFDVMAMEGIDVPFEKVGGLSSQELYAHIKKVFLKHRQAEAIYLLGSGWRMLDMIEPLERDLGVPVIHPIVTRCWEIQLRLSVRQPTPGYGRLLAEMIPG